MNFISKEKISIAFDECNRDAENMGAPVFEFREWVQHCEENDPKWFTWITNGELGEWDKPEGKEWENYQELINSVN